MEPQTVWESSTWLDFRRRFKSTFAVALLILLIASLFTQNFAEFTAMMSDLPEVTLVLAITAVSWSFFWTLTPKRTAQVLAEAFRRQYPYFGKGTNDPQ